MPYIPFAPRLSVAVQFQALLTPPSGFFSVFPHGTKFTIGLEVYLELEVNPPAFAQPSKAALLWTPPHPRANDLRGFHPL